MTDRALLIVILAAGKGTRMRSALPKVLHQVAGRSLLGHVMAAAGGAAAAAIAVVTGPGMDDVRQEAGRQLAAARLYLQADQRGTADALLAAREALAAHHGDVIVLFGDTPLMTSATIAAAQHRLSQADLVVVGFEATNPFGYGRILTDADGGVTAIREQREASPAEQQVRLCNSGVMGFRSERLLEILDAIGNTNSKGEFYLTDGVEIARAKGQSVAYVTTDEAETQGINDRAQLANVEAQWQAKKRAEVLAGGATMTAPETVFFAFDTVVGQDVTIEPFVVFGPGVTVANNVAIRAFTHIVGTDRKIKTGAKIAEGVEIGPFSRLRPGADIGRNAHVGNFVEIKNAVLEEGAKANHLSYLGDARVGAGANVGAGTITCNYDGFNKHHTDIGAGAFIGSNSALVAPVKIGDRAIIGAGSVITRDVAADALAVTRAPHEERQGWAERFRTMMARRKKQ
jgi:bifunctional UDP-N-acetylglucosamine pyrophosphorylase / glucosamine-1-phosphate N-acetyltransferase